MSADCIERLQRKTVCIESLVTNRALWIADVLFDQLTHGQSLCRRLIIWQRRYTFRRLRQSLSEQNFADPIPPQDGTRPRRARLLRQCGRLGQYAAARKLL